MKCQEKLNKRQGSRFKLNIPLRLIDLLNVVAIVRSSGPADFPLFVCRMGPKRVEERERVEDREERERKEEDEKKKDLNQTFLLLPASAL